MFGCLARIFAVLVFIVLLGIAWMFREPLADRARAFFGQEEAAPPSSIELADAATRKIELLVAGEPGSTVSLSEAEVQALMENRLSPFVPAYVLDPSVELDGDQVVMTARVPVDQLPQIQDELGEAARFLPDTTEITAHGKLLPLSDSRIALAVDKMSVASIPLPDRLIPRLVARLRRGRPIPGLPADALALPLPPGVASAYVRNDSLTLVAAPRQAQR